MIFWITMQGYKRELILSGACGLMDNDSLNQIQHPPWQSVALNSNIKNKLLP